MNVNVERGGKKHFVTFRLHGKLVSLELPKGRTSRKEVRRAILEYASLGARQRIVTEKDPAPLVEERDNMGDEQDTSVLS